jgi:C4-dicarboxylate-specific signal transduction histidine kinase
VEGLADPKIVVNVVKAPGIVRIKLKDNGKGIGEARLKELFKPFHTTKKHGTGLGLVISKKMLARMNGTIEITSVPADGTTVEITLPTRKTDKQ